MYDYARAPAPLLTKIIESWDQLQTWISDKAEREKITSELELSM
jgi:hypothetical protein